MSLRFKAIAENETFARLCVSAFILPLDPKVNDMSDIKTAVSEAVTNAIIHGYTSGEDSNRDEESCSVELKCSYRDNVIYVEVTDYGCGIEDIALAKKPLYTTKPELERSGMGFTIMEAFMDEVEVLSEIGRGTTVKMNKKLKL
jgi:stage II sporulation protein AB (anti-sigma F factor)